VKGWRAAAGLQRRGRAAGTVHGPLAPTRPSGGREFHFEEWTGALTSREKQVELDVTANTTLYAKFRVEDAAK
jgi:hypothetical protein